MALNTNALTDLATAKDHLDINAADLTLDPRIERWINAASQQIEDFTQRKLINQSHTEYQSGTRGSELVLEQWPAQKPSALYIDSDWSFAAESLVDANDYEVVDGSILILKSGNFPKGRRNVKIEYTAGYTDLPSSIEYACLLLVQFYRDHFADRRLGKETKTKSGETVTYSMGIPLEIAQLLEPYRRIESPLSEVLIDNG
jgi:hypothetical protein